MAMIWLGVLLSAAGALLVAPGKRPAPIPVRVRRRR